MTFGKSLGAAIALLSSYAVANAAPLLYHVNLSAENNSGVSGLVDLSLDGNLLTVSASVHGLTPNEVHMDHIHGLLGADAPNTQLAPPSADSNGDGYVEKTEALPYSGPPIFDLPPSGTPKGYASADASGNLFFTQTFDITNTALYNPDMLPISLTPTDILGLTGGNTVPLIDRIVEFHGLIVPAGVDGTPDAGNGFGYDPEMPVAAGLIQAGAATVPEPGSGSLAGAALAGLGLAVRARRRRS